MANARKLAVPKPSPNSPNATTWNPTASLLNTTASRCIAANGPSAESQTMTELNSFASSPGVNCVVVNPQPLDIVRQAYASYDSGEFARVYQLLSPEIEIRQTTELPWGGIYKG